jgi:hypothetical protein
LSKEEKENVPLKLAALLPRVVALDSLRQSVGEAVSDEGIRDVIK